MDILVVGRDIFYKAIKISLACNYINGINIRYKVTAQVISLKAVSRRILISLQHQKPYLWIVYLNGYAIIRFCESFP